jgi:hypothetical protein
MKTKYYRLPFAKLFRRIWRRLLGKHPVYDWGATSPWAVWIGILNGTMHRYIESQAKQIGKDLESHRNLHRLLKSKKITFDSGPEIEWKIKIGEK